MNEKFLGCVSRKAVTLNTSRDFVMLRPLTPEKLLQEIADYEKIRIEEFWEGLTKKSQQGNYVVGLNNYVATKVYTPKHLTNAALRRMVGAEVPSREAIKMLRTLPLEEQRRRLRLVMPEKACDLKAVLRTGQHELVIKCDLPRIAKEQGSPEKFIRFLFDRLSKNGLEMYFTPRFLEMLTLLWAREYLLFPFSFFDLSRKSKWESIKNSRYNKNKGALLEDARVAIPYKTVKQLSSYDRYFKQFFIISDVGGAEDMSDELISAFEQAMLSWSATTNGHGEKSFYNANSQIVSAAHFLRLYLAGKVPELGLVPVKAAHRASTEGGTRTNGHFLWVTERNSNLVEWQVSLKAYVTQLETTRTSGQISRLNWLMDYICSLTDPPVTPRDVVRSVHINDVTLGNENTWFEFVRKNVAVKRRTSVIYQAREFFDWYMDYLITAGSPHASSFRNPILSSDSLGYDRTNRSLTPRNALPAYVLNEMKSLLVENDFAFARAVPKVNVVVLDRDTSQTVTTWFPGICVCLYTMLEMPLRSHQARWLDSGELDEFIIDIETNKEVKNPNHNSIPGRKEGALRLHHDYTRQDAWLGLWVNTTKTVDYENPIGYSIPYVSEPLKDLLAMMGSWKRRYVPPFLAPIRYAPDASTKLDRARAPKNTPTVSPLFCDPTSTKRFPVGYDRLTSFYTSVLKETQDRIFKKYGHAIQLVAKTGEKYSWLVDLHSLRVSGITSMIENGVPLEVVSQFVAGHATLVMTLHYLKFSPSKMRAYLAAAHERAQEDTDFVGSELFMANLESFEPFLLGQEGAGIGAGLLHLKEQTGLLEINPDGICPGTSCSTGGPADSTKRKFTAVLGGKRCSLCRYWITGPAFVLGQVAEVNKLAYAIRQKGIQVAQLNEERIQQEDLGNQQAARNIRDRVETLNRELDIDLQDWSARYKYASQSVELMNEYLATKEKVESDSAPTKLPMLTKASKVDLKVTLEQAHEFALIDHITQMSQFQTGFNNEAVDLKKQKLLS